ncbi:MAG: hypothetical protein KBA72_02905 [Thermoanaerobaculia bacterium]|nr:hypothetical protein [Thermoanaerobaculia bacterium]
MLSPRERRLAWAAVGLGLCTWTASLSSAQLLGPEFRVNSYTTGSQSEPAVAGDASGNFVVVWRNDPLGFDSDISGQRFDSAGLPVGDEILVNSYLPHSQWYPKAAILTSGDFVATWSVYDEYEVLGRRFDGTGLPLGGDFQVNTYSTFQQYNSAVAARSDGGFVVVWNSFGQDGSYSGVFGQLFSPNGAPDGSEFQVNAYTTGHQLRPAVAVSGSDGFVVVWSSDRAQDGSGDGVFGQRFNSTGSPDGPEFRVNSFTTGSQYGGVVASASSGEFVVVWRSDDQDGDNRGIFGQRFDADGTPAGSEFRINSYTTGSQDQPAIAADASGDFVVVWQGLGAGETPLDILGQRFDPLGIRRGSEFRVNTFTLGFQHEATIAASGGGEFVVAWTSYPVQDGSYGGVFGQRLVPPLFADGFEAAHACAWSVANGGGCP